MADELHPNIVYGPRIPLEIPNVSLGQFLFARLTSHEPSDQLMFEAETGRSITCFEFLALGVRVAEGLRQMGIQSGHVICIMGKAGINAYAAAAGVLFQGGTVCPIDHKLPSDVFMKILEAIEPKLVFCDVKVVDDITDVLLQLNNPAQVVLLDANEEEEVQIQSFRNFVKVEANLKNFRPTPLANPGESIAFLVCSSGTMGTPKPVMLTNRNLMYQVVVWSFLSSVNKFLSCPAITFSFFYWISGVMLFMLVICKNVSITIVQNFDVKHILKVIEEQRPVWGLMSPALAKSLTIHPDFKSFNVSSVALLVTGGCALQKSLVDDIKKLWGAHVACRQSYGLTETAGSVTASSLDHDVLSAGSLLPGFQMKVVSITDGTILGPGQVGEIRLKSPSVMKGYMKNEEATDAVLRNGWYSTGDVGYYTEKGSIYITGRIKDFIRVNGSMVSPFEVEEVIMSLAGVADVGVVGIKIDEENHLPMALVVKKEGFHLTEDDVIKYVKGKLSKENHLRGGVCFVDVIPRTPSGKMKRLELLDRARALYRET